MRAAAAVLSLLLGLKNDLDIDPKSLGFYLRQMRDSAGISLRQLAKDSGVSHSQILRLESGEFDCFTTSLVRLCGALAIRPAELIEWCVTPSLDFYTQAVEDEFQRGFSDPIAGDKPSRKALKSVACGGAMVMAWLLRAVDPSSIIPDLDFPTQSIRDRFKKIAESLSSSPPDFAARIEFLTQLQASPIATLRSVCKFPNTDQLAEYVLRMEGPDSDLIHPWLPFFRQIVDQRIFPERHSHEQKIAEENVNQYLTEAETLDKRPNVIAQMSTLRERLVRATAVPGKKTELANALNPSVPLASVSRWLSGEREPGGEMALQLLAWVEAEEAKKESASAVTSSAGAKKTRMKKHHETEPHPSPRRE